MIRTSNPRGRTLNEENPYWISFSDIMSGLLVIFILAALMLVLQLDEQREEIDQRMRAILQADQIRNQILTSVAEELERQDIEVIINEEQTVLRIPSRTLSFESDQAELLDDQRLITERIGIALLNALSEERRFEYVDTIFVEGHTDSRASAYKGVGNWLLSADRAISVWNYWNELESTQGLAELENTSGEEMFSVSGYAATRRIIEGEITESDLEANRRIDIRFAMRTPSACEFEQIYGDLNC